MEREERKRKGPQVTVEPGPLRALLRHWAVVTLKPLVEGMVHSIGHFGDGGQ